MFVISPHVLFLCWLCECVVLGFVFLGYGEGKVICVCVFWRMLDCMCVWMGGDLFV